MGAVAHGEVVVAGVHDVGAGGAVAVVVGLVVAGDVLEVHLHGHDLGVAGLEQVGLLKVEELDGGLLHAAGDVGGLAVDLDGGLAGHVAHVGDLHVEGGEGVGGAGLGVHGDVEDGLALELEGEVGVAQAVAEAEGHLVVVVPLGGGAVGAGGIAGVAVAGHGVIVAGLVVAVAHVDALGLDGVGAGGEAQHAAGAGDLLGGVGVVHLAHVLHGGGGHVVGGEDVEETAGGAGAAAEDVGHAQHAVAAGEADPQDGVDLGVVLQVADLHGGGGVHQDDDVVAGLLGQLDGVPLVGGQSQRLLGAQTLGDAAGQVVLGLGAGAGDDHDGGVAVVGEAVLVAGVDGLDLADGGLAGVVDLLRVLVGGVVVGLVELVVDLHHGGVDVEAGALEVELLAGPGLHGLGDAGGDLTGGGVGVLGGVDGVGEVGAVLAQGLLQADVGALGLHAEAGAHEGHVGADAQQGHVGAAGEGKALAVLGVVLQQDGALGGLPAVQVHGGLNEGGGVAGAVLVEELGRGGELVVQGVLLGVVGDEHLAGGAQVGVDGAGVGLQDVTQDQGQGQGEAGQAGDAPPQSFFCALAHNL